MSLRLQLHPQPGALAALAALAVAFTPLPAAAQIVRAFTPRFSANANGDITRIANTLMTCSGGGNGANSCNAARAGTGNRLGNNDWSMVHVDVDGDGSTFNSSTANLALPAGATVLWAGLYWGGDSNNGARNQCRFGTPAAGYATVTAAQLDISGTAYSAYANVTTQVQAGMNGTYRVANVQATTGANRFAGWSLVVVYNLASLPIRNLVVNDGYGEVTPTSPPIDVPVAGFITPPAGAVQTRVGVITYEGDRHLTGDGYALNGTTLSDSQNPGTNFFNSTISQLGAHFTAKNPNYVNQLGYDSDLLQANGVLPNGATATTFRLSTNGDRYYPCVVTFATDLYAPVMEGNAFAKTVVDLDGAPARPGDVLEYTVALRNTGNDTAIQTVVRDTLPATLTFVAGSLSILNGPNAGSKTDAAGDDQAEYVAASRSIVARLGTGATAAGGGQMTTGMQTRFRFRVRVTPPAPNGSTVANQAAASFVGAQLGTVFATRSDGDTIASGWQPTTTTITAPVIAGTVFEDPNYGGGAGRSLAASAGIGRPGARVELYDAAGSWQGAATTNASGAYAFDGWSPGTYTVRVVSTTVLSSRPGAVATLVPVQTWRTNAPAGVAVGDPDRVGGENPVRVDAPANTTGATLPTLSATPTATPHSLGSVTLATTNVTGIDFGYNFDTIVNVNDTGQGSLRQFIVNANALSNTGLAQAGLTAGRETSIFMVAGAAARPGLRAGLANLLTAGVARIGIVTTLPGVFGTSTAIDGTTQTADGGDTNPGVLGTVGPVGVDGLALAGVPAPEVEIHDVGGLAVGLELQAPGAVVRGVAVRGFGDTANSDAHADIKVAAAATSALVESCVLGASATAFVDPGVAGRSRGDHVRVQSAASGVVRNCLLGFGGGSGIALTGGASGWTIEGCEIRDNAIGVPTADGILVNTSGGHTVRGNRIAGNHGPGIDLFAATGGCTIGNNTIAGNGVGTVTTAQTPGVRIDGSGHRLDRNEIQGNYGAGAMVFATGLNVVLTQNAIFGNGTIPNRQGSPPTGQIGIDLLRPGDSNVRGTSPFFTRNDAGDGDTGGNALLNFPVLESATTGPGTLIVTGWARPGSTIELFLTDSDASGFGEGQAFAATAVEGSAGDLDASSSSYSGPVNGIDQGTDTTNRFRFVFALPPGVVAGRALCATATLAGIGTSEFSGRVVVGGGVPVSGTVYADLDHDAMRDAGEVGAGVATWVKLVAVASPGMAQQVAAASPLTGAYAFASVSGGDYTLVLDDNALAGDVTPSHPPGHIGTEAAPGMRPATVPGIGGLVNQDFGLWPGGRIDGRVFGDHGAGAAGGAGANDGAQQAGEPGVAGVVLALRAGVPACPGGSCDSTVTDGAGDFSLWLPLGAAGAGATITQTNLTGWLSVSGAPGATGGAYARASDDITFTGVAGAIVDGVRFGDVPPNGFAAAGAGGVAPGGVTFYPHVFMAGSAGAVTFAATQVTSPAMPGWDLDLLRDLDCDGAVDPGEVPVGAGALPLVAGERVCLVARHAAPATAPAGATGQATLTARFTYAGAAPPPLSSSSVLSDLTTVLAGGNGLVLAKAVDRASALPGELLTYTITYTNLSNAPLTAIEVADATPMWTVFEDAACGTAGAGLSACGVSQQPSAGATGAVRWTMSGALLPGGSGSVSYRVRVQ